MLSASLADALSALALCTLFVMHFKPAHHSGTCSKTSKTKSANNFDVSQSILLAYMVSGLGPATAVFP